MEKLYSSKLVGVKIKRTPFTIRVDVYETFTVIRLYTKKLTVEQLTAIIDAVFFFGDVDYHIMYTDLATQVYCNSSSVCDKFVN